MGGSVSTAANESSSNDHSVPSTPVNVETPIRGPPEDARNDEEESCISFNSASTTSDFSLPTSHRLYVQRLHLPTENEETNINKLMRKTRDVAVETETKANNAGGDSILNRRSLLWSEGSINPRINARSPNGRSSIIGLTRGLKSPFYEGKTTFGGTSAKKARLTPLLTPSPVSTVATSNSSSLRSKTSTVCENGKKKLKSSEGLSDAAKRILATIESVSSPLEDARKIPFYGQSDHSKYLINTKRSSALQPYSRPSKPSTPFTSNLSSLRPLDKSRLKWISPADNSTTVNATSDISKDDSIRSKIDNYKPPNWSEGSSSTAEIPTGGKIRGRMVTRLRPSKDALDERLPVLDLPNVPLNITNLPKFDFKIQRPTPVTSKTVLSSLNSKNGVSNRNSTVSGSDFDSKLYENKSKPTTTIEEVRCDEADFDMDSEFSFSKPSPRHPDINQVQRKTSIIISSKDKNIQKSNDTEKKTDVSSDSRLIVPKDDTFSISQKIRQAKNRINADDAIEAVEDKEITDISQSKKESIATNIDVTRPSDANRSETQSGTQDKLSLSEPDASKDDVSKQNEDLFAKFKPPAGAWSCDTCFVTNNSSDACCIACETPRVSTSTAASAVPKSDFKFGFSVSNSTSSTSASTSISTSTSTSTSDQSNAFTAQSASSFTFGSKPSNEPSTTASATSTSAPNNSEEMSISTPTTPIQPPSTQPTGLFAFTGTSGSGVSPPKSSTSSSLFDVVSPSNSSTASTTTVSSLPSRPQTSIFNNIYTTEPKSTLVPPAAPNAAISLSKPTFNFGQPVSAASTSISDIFLNRNSPSTSSAFEFISTPVATTVTKTSNSQPVIFGSSSNKPAVSFTSLYGATTTSSSSFGQSSPFSSLASPPQSAQTSPMKITSSFSSDPAPSTNKQSNGGSSTSQPSILGLSQAPKFPFTSFTAPQLTTGFQFSSKPMITTASGSSSLQSTQSTVSSGFSFNLKPPANDNSSLSHKPQSQSATGFQFELKQQSPMSASPISSPTTGAVYDYRSIPHNESNALSPANGFSFTARSTGAELKPISSTSTTSASSFPSSKPSFTFGTSSSSAAPAVPPASTFSFGANPSTNSNTPVFGKNSGSATINSSSFGSSGFSGFDSQNNVSQPHTSAPASNTAFSFGNISTVNQPQPNGGTSFPLEMNLAPPSNFNFTANASQGSAPFKFSASVSASDTQAMVNRTIKKAKRRINH